MSPMSRFRQFIVGLLLYLLVTSLIAYTNDELTAYYGLELSQLEEWAKLEELAYSDPTQVTDTLRNKIVQFEQSNQTNQALYARVFLASNLLELDKMPAALEEIETALPLATESPTKVYLADLLRLKGRIFMHLERLEESMVELNKALALYKAIGFVYYVVDTKLELSRTLNREGNWQLALEHALEAKALLESSKASNLDIAITIAAIAHIYTSIEQNEKSIEYYKSSLALLDIEKDKSIYPIILSNIGKAYKQLDQIEESKKHFLQSLDLYTQLGDESGIAFCKHHLADFDVEEGNYKKAITTIEDTLPIFTKYENISMKIYDEALLAEALAGLERYNRADKLMFKVVEQAKDIERRTTLLTIWEKSYRYYAKRQFYEKAFSSHQNYHQLFVEDMKEKSKKKLNVLKIQYDTEQTELDNELLEKDNKLKQTLIAQQNSENNVLTLLIVMFLMLVAAGVFVIVKQLKIKKQLTYLALTDPLTRAPNRRAIFEYAQVIMVEAKKSLSPFCVAVIDLDHFKQVNDHYGHDKGDEVLIWFYDKFRSILRTSDRIGRIGGEEWLLVLPGLHTGNIERVFNRAREAVNRDLKTIFDDKDAITFSLGAVQFNADEDDSSLETLVKRADEATYVAKQRGRDTWVTVK